MKKSREFYVTKSAFESLCDENSKYFSIPLNAKDEGSYVCKVVLSFEIRPREIILTERELDEILKKYPRSPIVKHLKQDLFREANCADRQD